MLNKRLTVELPADQYEFLRREARLSETSVVGILRKLISDYSSSSSKRSRKKYNYKDDPFYKMKGSFKGPGDLSVNHDEYLYGGKDSGKAPL